jgi:hypothetical protein
MLISNATVLANSCVRASSRRVVAGDRVDEPCGDPFHDRGDHVASAAPVLCKHVRPRQTEPVGPPFAVRETLAARDPKLNLRVRTSIAAH